jgi:hypothetical protein
MKLFDTQYRILKARDYYSNMFYKIQFKAYYTLWFWADYYSPEFEELSDAELVIRIRKEQCEKFKFKPKYEVVK